ncbi:ABC transporter ATP-binding protein [Marinobacter zhanjiangensis]|uniref:ABC transporter ATP-binding protein n=1 Tax=Marinobacter zhanjiangensis TaxID=578215 RepID=A0ABQ3B0U3_9GAMM|nr:ABC transporter ATP-binding protein [Marinobacter zhanjiangensis]GGY72515.1 ABC transporter ATP-binding protein [Marinobacter zhanjiangensis]
MLKIHDLHAYYGKSHVLRGVNMSVERGEVVSLLGRNGVGRSTLCKAVMGLLPPVGHVEFDGKTLSGQEPHQIAHAGIGYVPEDRAIFPGLTVAQNLELGMKKKGQTGEKWTLEKVFEWFPRLKEREHTPAEVLSGGEQQMLSMFRALMGDPQCILVDEPTEGLAPKVVADVAAILKQMANDGLAVLLVEQKLSIALDVADRIYIMGEGNIVFEGTPEDLRNNPEIRKEWLEV